MLAVVTGLVVSLLAGVVYYIWRFVSRVVHLSSGLKHLPSPPGHPIIGNALLFSGEASGLFGVLTKLAEQYGKVCVVRIGPVPNIILHDAELIQKILKEDYKTEKPIDFQRLKEFIGDGLSVSSGDKWQQRRKLLQPTFHNDVLNSFIPIMKKHALNLVKELESYATSGNKFDMTPISKRVTINIIMDTTMGERIDDDDFSLMYSDALKTMGELIMLRAMSPIYKMDWIYNITHHKKREIQAKKVIKDYIRKAVLRREELYVNNSSDKETEEAGKKKRLALLDLLIDLKHNGGVLKNEDIEDEANNFVFAGHETTSSALTFTLYLFGKHPEIQERVLAEIMDKIPDLDTRELTLKDFNQLEYLEMCIKESLRLYTPGPLITRQNSTPLKCDGGTIQKGTRILIHFYAMHRNPEYFPEPDVFNPDRFNSENIKSTLNCYFPFSTGPRICIGQKYAHLELKVLLAFLLIHFEVVAKQEHEDFILMPCLVLTALNGVFLELRPRKRH